jgi:hypothetical protein
MGGRIPIDCYVLHYFLVTFAHITGPACVQKCTNGVSTWKVRTANPSRTGSLDCGRSSRSIAHPCKRRFHFILKTIALPVLYGFLHFIPKNIVPGPSESKEFSRHAPETDLWDRPATDLASFLVGVSRQVMRLSLRKLGPWKALATFSENYHTFLSIHGRTDNDNGCSAFRVAWWMEAQDGTIQYC